MEKSGNQKSIVSPDFFKQFCHRKNLIVLGKQMEMKIRGRLQNKHLNSLRDFLSDDTFITSINLSYNNITSEGLETLAEILVKRPQITQLILSNNNIHGGGIKYLANVKSDIRLECLRLNGNKMKEEFVDHLSRFLRNNATLKYLDLGETDLTNELFNELASGIIQSKLKGLVVSSIIGHNVKPQVTATIVQYICVNNKSLTMLYLRKLQLSDFDVDTICKGLKVHPGFKLLDLSCNNISDIGGGFITRYISQNRKIQGLFLAHNRISDGTSFTLSQIVPSTDISTLDVSHNCISEDGLLHLLYILQPRSSKLCILMWGNSFGPKCFPMLKKLYELRGTLTDFLDIAIYLDKQHNVSCDHNPELDIFRKNYYSALPVGTSKEPIHGTFPFHKIVFNHASFR